MSVECDSSSWMIMFDKLTSLSKNTSLRIIYTSDYIFKLFEIVIKNKKFIQHKVGKGYQKQKH